MWSTLTYIILLIFLKKPMKRICDSGDALNIKTLRHWELACFVQCHCPKVTQCVFTSCSMIGLSKLHGKWIWNKFALVEKSFEAHASKGVSKSPWKFILWKKNFRQGFQTLLVQNALAFLFVFFPTTFWSIFKFVNVVFLLLLLALCAHGRLVVHVIIF